MKSHEMPVNIDVCRCDVSNGETRAGISEDHGVQDGHGSRNGHKMHADRLWETVILPRRMRELGKTGSEISVMSMAEMIKLSNESF
jgi:hypothetical protein